MKPGRMVPGGMNMQAMMKQAQKMQAEMMKKQQELEEMEYTASAGGGAVSVTVKNKQIASLAIKPEAVDPEDAVLRRAAGKSHRAVPASPGDRA